MKSIIKNAIITLALVLGAVSVQAVTTWTAPSSAPPGNNVDAPINVGVDSQSKLGQLLINTDLANPFVTGLKVFGKSEFLGAVEVGSTVSPASIKIVDGNQGVGKVLASDANGLAGWVTPSGGGTTGSTDFDIYDFTDAGNAGYNSQILPRYSPGCNGTACGAGVWDGQKSISDIKFCRDAGYISGRVLDVKIVNNSTCYQSGNPVNNTYCPQEWDGDSWVNGDLTLTKIACYR